YLRQLAPQTGIADADLRGARVSRQSWGSTVRYQQLSGGVPVIGADVTVALDRSGALTAVTGHASDAAVDTTPRTTSAAAARTAAGLVARNRHLRASDLQASTPTLAVYDSSLLSAPVAPTTALVWKTEVTSPSRPDVREMVYVNADTGAVALHFSEVDQDAVSSQTVCDFHEVRQDSEDCTSNVVPDPTTAGGDAQKAYENALATDTFYRSVLGRAGIDGNNLPILSTVDYCPTTGLCPYDNAYWNGTQMVYGQGLPAALDVVGHELTHGVTQYTSDLMYYYQSGAINESMSDVMGELIDQLEGSEPVADRWVIGQDVPDDGRGLHDLRNMKDPLESRGGAQPDMMTSSAWDPGQSHGLTTDSGGVHTNSGVGNKAAYLITEGTRLEPGGAFDGQSFTGMTDNDGHALTGLADGSGETADRTQVLQKVATLYYTLEQLMPSWSTYADLDHLLPQACASLNTGSPVGPLGLVFHDADCAAVSHAVAATQMDQDPTSAAARPRPMAPQCTNGGTQTMLWSDDFESPTASAARWVVSPKPSDANGDGFPETAWFTNPPSYGLYPHSGRHNLWGDDPDTPQLLTAELNTTITAHPQTYLWFAHAYDFDSAYNDGTGRSEFYDGGQVQYSTYSPTTRTWSTWHDAGSMLVNNGYTGTLASGSGNLHAGQHAFVGTSGGYTASRLDLTPLAGKQVRLAFVVASDSDYGGYGWFVDDVKVFSCSTTLTVTPPRTVPYGTTVALTGRLTRTGTSTPLPQPDRTVLLYQRFHGTTAWGSAVRSTMTTATGTYGFGGIRPARSMDYRVTFPGGSGFTSSSGDTQLSVAPRVTLSVNDRTAYRGQLLHFTGGVGPNHHGQKVSLQRYVGGGRWSTITTATLSSASGYSLWWRPGYAVTYTVRVLKPADSDHAAAASNPTTISVR
ncbi:MAG TPA: M4 family metallopeptidase, partial [Oryzihumus sp.]|nr:M4 family metallopeptidase [Oryzihumus sp.]